MSDVGYPRIRGRLAPSPTGALHLGNARSFMIAWLSIRSRGGRLVMRMEDLDHPKNKPGAAAAALEDLRWLGFDWDEGPDVGGPDAPYTQTARTALYAQALERLQAQGLIYPCVCTRRDVEAGQSAPHTEEGLYYPGTCRGRFLDYEQARRMVPEGRLPAWRFRVPEGETVRFEDGFCGTCVQDVSAHSGDFVLARDAQGAGYMLAVVVDDAAMGITEVVRGDDLLSATPRQLLLYRALGLKPPIFVHVPLVVSEDGRRLAKRHGDTRISAFREAGLTAGKIIGLLAGWCGWAAWGECLTLREVLPRFDMRTLPHDPVVLTPRVQAELGMKNE
ncbi:MAG: tRNA glutamyl-Q(34) synthetase GluQRS [bacterium]